MKLRGDCESRKYQKTLFLHKISGDVTGYREKSGDIEKKFALAGDYLPLAGAREFTPEIRRVGFYGLLTGMIFCFRHRKNIREPHDHSLQI